MIYLILSIVCSAAIFIIFRSFERYKVDTFSAIVVNYLVAGSTGLAISDVSLDFDTLVNSDWAINGLILGLVFISLFYIMAQTAQKLGASVASIANKMALIIPVVFAIMYYNDSLNTLKAAGIILALVGIVLSTLKPRKKKSDKDWKILLFPIIVFLGSGFIDTFLKYTQEYHLNSETDTKLFSSAIFLVAFSVGVIITLIRKAKGLNQLQTWLGGIILGLINYGSIYFLILTFDHAQLESSVIFPINNMGVVILTTALSYFIFSERFSVMNKIGVALSIVSILMISFS